MLMVNCATVIVSCLIKIIPVYEVFIIGRVLSGVITGIWSTTVPLFLKEIAPPKYRGFAMGLSQQMITVGVGACFSFGLLIPDVTQADGSIRWENAEDKQVLWRIFFIIPALVAVVQLLLLLFVFNLENPGYMCSNNNSSYDSFISKMIDMKSNGKINDSEGNITDISSIIRRRKLIYFTCT